MHDAKPPPNQLSSKLMRMLLELTPAERAQAIKIAAKLLAIKAAKNRTPATMLSPPAMLTPAELAQLRQHAHEMNAYGRKAFPPKTLPPTELENIRARLRPQDRDRLRPDGLLEPALPPWALCGGLESPYLIAPASPDLGSPPTSSEPEQPPLSAV